MGVFKRTRTRKDGKKVDYWYIRYWVNGKPVTESVGKLPLVTKTQARALLEDRRRKVRLGQLDMITAKIPTVNEFTKTYLNHIVNEKQNRSAVRSAQALAHFNDNYGDKKLTEITSADIDAYKGVRLKGSDVKKGAKPATVNRELAVIKNMFNYARRQRVFFSENPVTVSGMLEANNLVERILTPEEETKLLNEAQGYLKDVILIALNSGMRQAEMLGLRWTWIDLDNGFIELPQTNTKSKKMRRVPINSVVRTILLKRKLEVGKSEYVFPSPSGIDKHLTWLKRSFKTACRRAGIEGLRFHDLRHTCASRAVEAGIPLHAVTKLLGHSSIKVTERYSHPEQSVKEAVEILADFSKNRYQNRIHQN